MATDEQKKLALADFLGIEPSELSIDEERNTFSTGTCEWLVLTDEEADKKTREEIEGILWAFNPDFILKECNLIKEMDGPTLHSVNESLRSIQEKCCENCNDFFKGLIKGTCGLDKFVQDAISADGRGHFLAYYDFREHFHEDSRSGEDFYIYQIN